MPLVSIIITTFNRSNYLKQAIDSALRQDYGNLEIIVSDNCSTDGTYTLMKRYSNESKVKYFRHNKNLGMRANYHAAVEEFATGDFVSFVSSDDYLINPKFISDAINLFNKYENITLVHGKNLSFYEGYSEKLQADYSYEYYKDNYYRRVCVPGSDVFEDYPLCHSLSFGGSVFRRDDIVRHKPYKEKCYSFDAVLALKLSQEGNIGFLSDDTYAARRHSKSFTTGRTCAKDYILNQDYIDAVFRFCLSMKNSKYSEVQLRRWRQDMRYSFFENCMKDLYCRDRQEFRRLRDALTDIDPILLKEIEKKISFKIFRFVNADKRLMFMKRILHSVLVKIKHQYKNSSLFS